MAEHADEGSHESSHFIRDTFKDPTVRESGYWAALIMLPILIAFLLMTAKVINFGVDESNKDFRQNNTPQATSTYLQLGE